MNTEKNISQMRKGVLELCILSIIGKRDEVYASDILHELKQAQLIVVEGTLYPLLTRLKNDELLSYRWEESKSGPPRKYYRLTESGQQLLTELKNGWNELVTAVEQIIKIENQA
ncbi:MAG: PadR family transcriptional regulator [Bacteroidetes bacterium]|nr:PadR family transcriptional regulator [Bacteroidota bacterium]MBU1580688.1 PadR family transcriptional regulator [Bacteroidota bacterium]MBU2466019.1 PadR family transcriptional regulator [Bacteroidota bacterium]MBU2558516.1 PadR family transcriptional regulator [Bacteroidota bacterium]